MDIDEKKWISDFHGKELDPIAKNDRRNNENGILFLCEYYYFKHLQDDLTHEDIAKFKQITENIQSFDENCNVIKGLYDRGSKESLSDDKDSIRTISHDNLTAISGFSYLFQKEGLSFHKDIAEYGREHQWRFDNVYPENPRWSRRMLFRDIVYYSYLDGKIWAKFFIWWVVLTCLFSCYKTYDYRPQFIERLLDFFKTGKFQKWTRKQVATSGKCMTFVRLYPIRNKLIGKIGWRLCSYFINKNIENGWKGVFNIYFRNPENPINIRVNKAYENNKKIW